MAKKEMREWIEKNCTYLVLYSLEGDLVDYFMNVTGINDLYKKRHEEILEAGASNVTMTFTKCQANTLTAAIFSSAVDKTSLVIYSVPDFYEAHPEVFIEE